MALLPVHLTAKGPHPQMMPDFFPERTRVLPLSLPPSDAVWQQVARLEQSPHFAGSDRLFVFLRFILTETLQGDAQALKEAVIGQALYGREPPYDPRIDSTVRVEARRLRRKLKEYYAGPGADDPVRILLAPRGYRPMITAHEAEPPTPGPAIFRAGRGAAIALLPLRALSADPADQAFADGLTDELLFALGQIQGLRVAARSEAFQYRDRSVSVAEVASRLAVDAVLQGTVRRYGDHIRVTVETCDPQGFTVWADRFDAAGDDLLTLQERIAATILSRTRLDSSKIRARQVGPGPEALSMMARIYRARQTLDRQTPQALAAALAEFREVARCTPDSARGHAGVADSCCDLFRLGLISHADALATAEAACAAALQIDPASVEAQAARAVVAAWLRWDRAAAEDAFQQAVAVGENARAARLYAGFLTYQGRHDAAARYLAQARGLEPFSVQQDIAESICHFQSRRFDLVAAGGASDVPEVRVFAALARVFLGDRDGLSTLGPTLIACRDYPDFVFAEAELLAWGGMPGPAREKIRAPGASHYARACLAAALGDGDAAIEALRAAVAGREVSAVWMGTDVRFDAVRPRPEFQALIDALQHR